MFGGRIVEERFERTGIFGVSDMPVNNPPAEDINDDMNIKMVPFAGAHQLGDTAGPCLVQSFSE